MLFLLFNINVSETNKEVSTLGYKTKYFHLSSGVSKKMFENMKNDGLSQESLKQFIMLEDRLLGLEHSSVCTGTTRRYEAFAVSDKIKDTFVAYDFSYHGKHLKQISEPLKIINRNITC